MFCTIMVCMLSMHGWIWWTCRFGFSTVHCTVHISWVYILWENFSRWLLICKCAFRIYEIVYMYQIFTFKSGCVLPSLLYRFLWVQKGQVVNAIFLFPWQATSQPLRPCSRGWLFQLTSSFGMQQHLPSTHSCTCR